MNGKEGWIEKVLESADNIQRAGMEAALQQRISGRLKHPLAKVISVQPQTIWKAAAVIALLVCLNIYSMVHLNKAREEGRSGSSSVFAQEYFSYLNQSDL